MVKLEEVTERQRVAEELQKQGRVRPCEPLCGLFRSGAAFLPRREVSNHFWAASSALRRTKEEAGKKFQNRGESSGFFEGSSLRHGANPDGGWERFPPLQYPSPHSILQSRLKCGIIAHGKDVRIMLLKNILSDVSGLLRSGGPGYCPGAGRNASPEPAACKDCRSCWRTPGAKSL